MTSAAIAAIPRLNEYVFPAARDRLKDKPATIFNGWSKPKVAFDKRVHDRAVDAPRPAPHVRDEPRRARHRRSTSPRNYSTTSPARSPASPPSTIATPTWTRCARRSTHGKSACPLSSPSTIPTIPTAHRTPECHPRVYIGWHIRWQKPFPPLRDDKHTDSAPVRVRFAPDPIAFLLPIRTSASHALRLTDVARENLLGRARASAPRRTGADGSHRSLRLPNDSPQPHLPLRSPARSGTTPGSSRLHPCHVYNVRMTETETRIVQLFKTLPPTEQRALVEHLAETAQTSSFYERHVGRPARAARRGHRPSRTGRDGSRQPTFSTGSRSALDSPMHEDQSLAPRRSGA